MLAINNDLIESISDLCLLPYFVNIYFGKKIFALWVFFMFLLSPADFFKINIFQKNLINTIGMSKSVGPDQDLRSPVGPDLGPNSLSKLSADYKSCR